jgi:putative endonuclease
MSGFLKVGTAGMVCAMTRAKDAVGAYGERVAVRYLIDQGMVLLDRNWRCSGGEVDAILRDGDTLVFAEVKTRRGNRFGSPAESVVPAKVKRLRRLAGMWLAQARIRPREVRFDVISVLPQESGGATVEHLRGAF